MSVVLLTGVVNEQVLQHKAVAVEPQGITGVEAHHVAEQGNSDGSSAHGGSSMSTFVGLHDVGCQAANGSEKKR